jgi:hypothetical protein
MRTKTTARSLVASGTVQSYVQVPDGIDALDRGERQIGPVNCTLACMPTGDPSRLPIMTHSCRQCRASPQGRVMGRRGFG